MSTVTALSNVADGRRMKADLQDLRRRGAIRTSECSLGESGVRSCSLCRAGLGWIVNRGAVCQACRKRVCKACREYAVRTVDWVCTVCYKRTQLQTATGEWMNEFIKKPKQWKDSKFSLSPAEIIKSTIRRSWTICDPNPRWSSSRDSPEFRPYNSLPRGRDVTDYPSLLSQRSVQTSGQSIDTITSTEKLSEADKEGGISVSPRQRRVSQFERTLSELYGTKKNSATRKMSTSDENGLDKTSTEEDNLSSTSSNGIENRKIDIKPSKIPARKKVQYTRSETSVINSPKQPLRKQTSLQPSRKQKERTFDEAKEEKHVSFDYETTKKIDDVHSSPRLEIKSNIPKSKTRNSSSRTDSTSTTRSSISGESVLLNNNEITESNCDINNLNREENEDNCKGTEKEEEPISGSLFRKVTIKKRRHDFRKTHAFDEDDISTTESNSSPIVGPRSGSKSASPSPIHGNTLTRGSGSISSADCQGNDDDIDRLVAMHHNRNSLSSLGLRSDSMASVYSGAGEGRYGIVAVRGQVEFGLQYNYKAGALEICVKQCKDLAAVDQKRSRSDPYVKVYLLPDKSKSGKRKTKVKKHTLNPVFDETLKFHLSLSGLETRTLWLTVWHSDMFGRNDFLGEVMMPLENKVFDDPTPKWYNLQERTEPFEELPSYKGDVIIGLKFVPPDMTVHKKGKRSRGALHVLVKEAKSLTAVKANGTSDPFCKSYLLPDKGRSNKQKTPILRRTTNPVWNHTFIYDDVTLQELAERALELTVWDHDRLASNEFLGGVRFSLGTNKHYGKNVDWMDATGKELSLWQSMLERPNFWVEGCVTLRSSLDNRCS